MLKKLIIPSLALLMAASSVGCFVKTTGPNRRCPYPATWDAPSGRCVNKRARADVVIPPSDHRPL